MKNHIYRRWFLCLLTSVCSVCPANIAVVAAGEQLTGHAAAMHSKLTQIPVPSATCCAFSDTLSMLVVGHRDMAGNHLSVFRLAENGHPKGEPAHVRLPRPQSLGGQANYALGVAFHPRLPMLYVWQDISGPKEATPQVRAAYREFDHLILFTVKDAVLTLAGAFARGDEFCFGQSAGLIAVASDGRRVFMPNMRDTAAAEVDHAALGYYDLAESGMPEPVPVPIEGTLDGYGLNKFDMQVRPTWIGVSDFKRVPVAHGFVAPSKSVVLFSGIYGPAAWDTQNRRAALNIVHIRGIPRLCYISAHASLPVVYGAGVGASALFSMPHADGYPTLLPRTASVPHAGFRSPPVAVPGTPGVLVIGGVNGLHVMPLDTEGMVTGLPQTIPVINPEVCAIVYSERYDRLYVAVEKIQ